MPIDSDSNGSLCKHFHLSLYLVCMEARPTNGMPRGGICRFRGGGILAHCLSRASAAIHAVITVLALHCDCLNNPVHQP